MRSAQILHAAVSHTAQAVEATAPHTAGWLRYFVVVVILMAWLCLRGYAKGSDEQK